MDAFEQLAAEIFWNEGYWVRTGFKVELTRDEKIRIGRHSSPRWEIDLVAYRAASIGFAKCFVHCPGVPTL